MKLSLTLLSTAALLAIIAYMSTRPARPPTNNFSYLSQSPQASIVTTPESTLTNLPEKKVLSGGIQVFQTFNNCGPAALSMALSHFGISRSQQELGMALRPYQVPGGNNDDKSVVLSELADKASEYGFITFHRPAGDIETLKGIIAQDMPVITRTLLDSSSDIGHYRVVKGYDDTNQQLLQDDSLQGANLWYSYNDFMDLWKAYNFEYLVLVPKEKLEIAKSILGKSFDETHAWEKAVVYASHKLAQNPDDTIAQFNLSVAYYHLGDFNKATLHFENVEAKLPFRTLWYQIEPVLAYYQIGDYNRVLSLTEDILNNHNRAFSELYHLRALIYEKQGNDEAATLERENILRYNIHYFENSPLNSS
ncbi:hypothetical protein A2801_02935 [Candidatus Woesebacteria bacterium RIFCSPHIGHO2_01_FULL_41_10]|uniref:Peptidase C39-like domain-containing protein n=1 Tax=Candidatus Woesebacteria bacterium RIFCSPHIGHO2_01_FULL_41_10 TaxID=1802500 RepID=A0A1F7YNH1_9BACT|nr:MAG: hypothetical protein A2801_02935 [Candidatus Woesebacteria bacterium RIFCSPHIGHO2_01_FULL_41_10]